MKETECILTLDRSRKICLHMVLPEHSVPTDLYSVQYTEYSVHTGHSMIPCTMIQGQAQNSWQGRCAAFRSDPKYPRSCYVGLICWTQGLLILSNQVEAFSSFRIPEKQAKR